MYEELRTPFFVLALVLIAIAVLIEIGAEIVAQLGFGGPIGLGIRYSVLLDGMLLYMMALMGLALVLPARLMGTLQGIVTLVVSLLVALGSILMNFLALFALLEMVALLLAVPFGTIAYFALFGHFSRGAAAVELSAIMTLKLCFAGSLVLAQQRFLANKLMVFSIVLALVGTVIVSFLHGLVPIFLVSITDAIAAIVLAILGLILAIVLLLRSIPAIVKAVV